MQYKPILENIKEELSTEGFNALLEKALNELKELGKAHGGPFNDFSIQDIQTEDFIEQHLLEKIDEGVLESYYQRLPNFMQYRTLVKKHAGLELDSSDPTTNVQQQEVVQPQGPVDIDKAIRDEIEFYEKCHKFIQDKKEELKNPSLSREQIIKIKEEMDDAYIQGLDFLIKMEAWFKKEGTREEKEKRKASYQEILSKFDLPKALDHDGVPVHSTREKELIEKRAEIEAIEKVAYSNNPNEDTEIGNFSIQYKEGKKTKTFTQKEAVDSLSYSPRWPVCSVEEEKDTYKKYFDKIQEIMEISKKIKEDSPRAKTDKLKLKEVGDKIYLKQLLLLKGRNQYLKVEELSQEEKAKRNQEIIVPLFRAPHIEYRGEYVCDEKRERWLIALSAKTQEVYGSKAGVLGDIQNKFHQLNAFQQKHPQHTQSQKKAQKEVKSKSTHKPDNKK